MVPARRLLLTRGLRGFVDGMVSVMLGAYLAGLGFDLDAIGLLVTSTLLGSGLLTLLVGTSAHRHSLRGLLIATGLLMALTGLGFASVHSFALLLMLAVVGTLNPSAGDVSVFLPLEQAALSEGAASAPERAALFARYNVVGSFTGALGALAVGAPQWLSKLTGRSWSGAQPLVFVLYAAIGLLLAALYRGLPDVHVAARPSRPLEQSRAVVVRLAALFSVDAFGGGFVVQSMLSVWLFQKYQLDVAKAGSFFFVTSLAGALSQFLSPKIASRIGLIRTMVYTHIPANLFLIAAAFMPTRDTTMLFLVLRACVSSMDVPARQAYVMAVVPPQERAAAASVTNVPRSLASALSPVLAGIMLRHTTFGWPLICAGVLKIGYDLALLRQFHAVAPDAG